VTAHPPWHAWPRRTVTIITGYRDPCRSDPRHVKAAGIPVPLHGRLAVVEVPDTGYAWPAGKLDTVWRARPRDGTFELDFDLEGFEPVLVIRWRSRLRNGRVRLRPAVAPTGDVIPR